MTRIVYIFPILGLLILSSCGGYLGGKYTKSIQNSSLLPNTIKLVSLVDGKDVESDNLTVAGSGDTIIYLSNKSTSGAKEIFTISSDGSGTEIKLTGGLPSCAEVLSYELTSDDSKILYLANQDDCDKYELYSTNMDGTNNVKLNNSLVSGGSITSFTISPANDRIAYIADLDIDDVFELYSVNIDGSSHVKLNTDLGATDKDVESFLFNYDGSIVVYDADQDTVDELELYSVPTIGLGCSYKAQ